MSQPPQDVSEFRDYAWNYFKAHAEARLTTFRFYLVFCTLIVAGMLAITGEGKQSTAAAGLAFLLSFLSFVYWKVDVRHKQIIKHAEAALMFIESESRLPDQDGMPHILKLFQREEHATRTLKRFPRSLSLDAHFSYSICVNLVFIIFGATGVILGVRLLFI